MAFDVVVVGGGSAGCVAAARLSGAGRLRVLLIEAGPDYASVGQLPGDVADASAPTTEHDWGFVSEPDDSGRTIGLPRGRLIGGCSATNGAFLMRGWPDDYDRWAAAGNPGSARPNTREVLYLVNRPGNVPSHAGAAQWSGSRPGRSCRTSTSRRTRHTPAAPAAMTPGCTTQACDFSTSR